MNQRIRASRPAALSAAQRVATLASPSPSLKAMRVEDVRALQSAAGNRIARDAVEAQRTMSVGAADNALEREADAVARDVLAKGDHAETQRAPAEEAEVEEEELQAKHLQRVEEDEELQAKHVQRVEEDEELQAKHVQRDEEDELQAKHVQRDEEDELQAKHVQRDEEDELQMKRVQRDAAPEVGLDGGSASAATSSAIETARGGGRPLEKGVRTQMESAFGADFSGVRTHEGAESKDLNQRLSARAFTTGNDIFIGRDGLNPGSRAGKELLAHELTHVVQQGAARKAKRRS